METEMSQGFHDFLNKKRKRFPTKLPQSQLDVSANYDFDLDGGHHNTEFEIHENMNKDGTVMKKTYKPNSHKVLITEEKMTDALRELQLDKNEETKRNELNLHLTDELRTTMDKFKREDDELRQRFLNLNKERQDCPSKFMQIVPWIQNEKVVSDLESKTDDKSSTSSDGSMDSFENISQDSSDFNKYKVEEPSEKKNTLKRKHSEVNKLTIEELKPTETFPSYTPSHYLVELPVDEPLQSNQTPSEQNKSTNFIFSLKDHDLDQKQNVIITEFVESPFTACFNDAKHRRITDEEEMDQ